MTETATEPAMETRDYYICPGCGAKSTDECVCEPEIQLDTFAIDSEDRAEWLLGKLADLEAAAKRINENAAQMVQQLTNRRTALLRRFGPELQDLCEAKRAEPGFKGKTVKFLNGACNWRAQKGGPRLVDAEAALKYLDEHDELFEKCVTVSTRVRSTDYVALIEEAGELLPGIEVVPESEAFYVLGSRIDREEE